MSDDRTPGTSWFPRRWLAGAALVIAAVVGLLIAGAAEQRTGYVAGLFLFGMATFGVFAIISTSYGDSPLYRLHRFRMFPENGALCWAVGGTAGIVGLAGLFVAGQAEPGGLAYYSGLGLFAAAIAYDFMLLKGWFDRQSAGRN